MESLLTTGRVVPLGFLHSASPHFYLLMFTWLNPIVRWIRNHFWGSKVLFHILHMQGFLFKLSCTRNWSCKITHSVQATIKSVICCSTATPCQRKTNRSLGGGERLQKRHSPGAAGFCRCSQHCCLFPGLTKPAVPTLALTRSTTTSCQLQGIKWSCSAWGNLCFESWAKGFYRKETGCTSTRAGKRKNQPNRGRSTPSTALWSTMPKLLQVGN